MRATSGTPWWRRRSFLVVISLLAVMALVAVACDSDNGDAAAGFLVRVSVQRNVSRYKWQRLWSWEPLFSFYNW